MLTVLQRLPKLAMLDFTNAYLSGSIPSNLTFPALQTLLLSSNNIMVGALTSHPMRPGDP